MNTQHSSTDQAAIDQLIPLADEYEKIHSEMIRRHTTAVAPLAKDFSNLLSREQVDWQAVDAGVKEYFADGFRYDRAKAAYDYVVQFREGTWG